MREDLPRQLRMRLEYGSQPLAKILGQSLPYAETCQRMCIARKPRGVDPGSVFTLLGLLVSEGSMSEVGTVFIGGEPQVHRGRGPSLPKL